MSRTLNTQGLIQIEMLKTIEQLTGKSIVDLFDWVVGTSIGGILALGMIYGEVCYMYELRHSHLSRPCAACLDPVRVIR